MRNYTVSRITVPRLVGWHCPEPGCPRSPFSADDMAEPGSLRYFAARHWTEQHAPAEFDGDRYGSVTAIAQHPEFAAYFDRVLATEEVTEWRIYESDEPYVIASPDERVFGPATVWTDHDDWRIRCAMITRERVTA